MGLLLKKDKKQFSELSRRDYTSVTYLLTRLAVPMELSRTTTEQPWQGKKAAVRIIQEGLYIGNTDTISVVSMGLGKVYEANWYTFTQIKIFTSK